MYFLRKFLAKTISIHIYIQTVGSSSFSSSGIIRSSSSGSITFRFFVMDGVFFNFCALLLLVATSSNSDSTISNECSLFVAPVSKFLWKMSSSFANVCISSSTCVGV